MSTEVKQEKSGRTPEQQAARDARKAAKLAAAAEAAPHAESSTQATAASPNADADADASSAKKEKKRRREDDEENNDPTLMEIDVKAPEPLSKAEARAARKRQKKGLPDLPPKQSKPEKRPKTEDGDSDADDDDLDAEREKAAKAKAEASAASGKRQNSIWIGNLSFRTTPESLKAFIESGVEKAGGQALGAITRINMPKKAGGQKFANNKGFAYVDFATPELQQIGVSLSESFFEGRKLLMKLGTDYAADPNARTPKPDRPKVDPMAAGILKRQQHPEGPTLFMGNLPFDATEEAIRDMIEDHAEVPAAVAKKDEGEKAGEDAGDAEAEGTKIGETEAKPDEPENKRAGKKSGLRKVRLGQFEDTGRCKGFAFLDFYLPADATKTLINRKNHFFGGRKLNLQYASEDATKRSGANRNREAGAAPVERKPRYTLPRDQKTGYVRRPEGSGDGEAANREPREWEAPKSTDFSGEAREPRESRAPKEAVESAGPRKDVRGKRWEATGRPRPGAALAMAKREKVGIVKAEGEKIVFD